MYNAYLFDLYGTLVDIKTDEQSAEVWHKLATFYGYHGAYYEPVELEQAYHTEEEVLRKKAIHEYGKGSYPEIVLEQVFLKLFAKKGVTVSNEMAVHTGQFFRILSLQYIKLYRNVEWMLQTLKHKQKKIYLLSNAQRIFTDYEMNYLGIKPYFDGILFSSDAGFMKPDIRFYQKAIHMFSVDPKKAIMIGNDYTCDILGAKEAGLDAFYVHTNLSPAMPDQLEEERWMMGMDGAKLVKRVTE